MSNFRLGNLYRIIPIACEEAFICKMFVSQHKLMNLLCLKFYLIELCFSRLLYCHYTKVQRN